MNTSEPFDLLLDLEARTVKSSVGLPALDQVDNEWVGVGFRIGESKLIAAMSDVKEILDLPEFTMVPGVKSWIVGVANVRGSLLPIMDMKGYLLGDDIKQRQKYGMRHFRESDEITDMHEVHESISPYIERTFKQDDEYWPVISFYEMTQDERFAHVSL
jgi:twitching motility protein PilI